MVKNDNSNTSRNDRGISSRWAPNLLEVAMRRSSSLASCAVRSLALEILRQEGGLMTMAEAVTKAWALRGRGAKADPRPVI